MEKVKKHTQCRLCGGPLELVLDYGAMPLANALTDSRDAALVSELFEQQLMFCNECLLGQLSVVVSPETLYKGYAYRSATSGAFRKHCEGLARELVAWGPIETVLDIAGNDGTMIKEVLKKKPVQAFVCDVTQDENPEDYVKIKRFWNEETASDFLKDYGTVDAVIAQNVVGHVDHVIEFFKAVRKVLTPGGVFVVEVPSFPELVRSGAFDTVYHEHLSYWTATAMRVLAEKSGLVLCSTEFSNVHCGSFRFWLSHGMTAGNGSRSIEQAEREFFQGPGWGESVFQKFGAGRFFQEWLRNEIVIGVTASAKATVLLNAYAVPVDYVVDSAASKHRKFIPGVGLEIKPFTRENLIGATVALILSRNLVGELTEQLRQNGFKGIIVAV